MKEATGELNATVVIVIVVGVLSAFFFGVIWPTLKNNFDRTSKCKKATCDCSAVTPDNKCDCWIGDKSVAENHFECIYKG